MKKLLFLLLAVILPMAVYAQLLDNNRMFQCAPYALKVFNQHQLMTTSRADLAANQMIMGHYDTDDVAPSTEGIGLNSTGKRQVGTVITPEEVAVFQGGKIVKFRVGLANAASISKVLIAKVSATGAVGSLQQISCSANAAGWNEITLSSPYTISLNSTQGLFIGFEYQQTAGQYPLSAVKVGDIYPTLWKNGLNWQDLGLDSYGNLSIQCVVESDNFPEYMVNVNSLTVEKFIKLGNDIEFTFKTKNFATATVAAGACTYDVLIDGQVMTTLTNTEAFGKNALTIEGAISSAGLASGKHTLTIAVNSLNGEPVASPASVSKDFTVFENGFARQMHIVEQFTSTYCTYCPLGNNMLSILTTMRDDIIWIGIHGNMSSGTDPMSTVQGDTIMAYQGGDSYPSGSFDRATGWESDNAIVTGLGFYEQYHQQVAEEIGSFFDYLAETPSYATININSTFDADTRKAVITVDGDITSDFDTMMGADSKLSVFITEDGLVYKQLNSGTWINDYVHNNVFRKALGSARGVNINKVDGDKYSNTFELTIPSTWKADNLNVVAFISRPLINGASGNYADMFVNQANKRKLGEYDEPATSMQGDVNGTGVVNMDDLSDLINYLLTNDATGINMEGADCWTDGDVNMDDLSELINYLLTGAWTE